MSRFRPRSALRNRAEWALAEGLLGLAALLPDRAVIKVAQGTGWLLSKLVRSRGRVVAKNLELAYGKDAQAPDAAALTRACFANLVLGFLELRATPRSSAELTPRVAFENPEDPERLLALVRRTPVVFAASHYGAFELSGVGGAAHGIPLTTLARPFDNPFIERRAQALRERTGQRMASNRGGMLELKRSLAEGRSVAVLTDLNHPGAARIFVRFFGRQAATAPTAARLALRAGVPIVPCFTWREGPGLHYRIAFEDPIAPPESGNPKEDVQLLMQAVTDRIEARVRAHPERWMWTHRRWRTRPPEEDSP